MRTIAFLGAVLIAIAPLNLHGQGLTPAQVEELRKAHDEVFVQVAGSERGIHGQAIERTPEALTLMVDGRPYRIPMASVLRIDTMTRRFIGKGAGIGALVGAGVGAWCAYICGQGMDSDSSVWPAVLSQVGIGTAIGAVSSMGARGLKTIYNAPGPAQPYSGPLPCPATPLVVSSPLVVPERATWKRNAWFGDYRSMGDRRCDGLAIRRANTTGTWQSGIELNFKDSGQGVVSVTARITAQLQKGDRDKIAVVLIEILDGAVVLAGATARIEAVAGEEVRAEQVLKLPAPALAKPANLLLRLTVVTSYD